MPECPATDGSSPRQTSFDGPFDMCIDPSKRYTAEMVTSMGSLTIALDPAAAPKTVNNFVSLARYHYYDGLTFHRVIQGFVLQGGCPEGNGRGSPGYSFKDEINGKSLGLDKIQAFKGGQPNPMRSRWGKSSSPVTQLIPRSVRSFWK